MKTYDEALATSRDQAAFANSVEGVGWMANWCDRCIHDKGARDGTDPAGCPLIMLTMLGRTPVEFLDGPRDERGRYGIADQYHCVEFRDEDDPGPGYEPTDPVSPDQIELFDAESYARPRMFADVVAEVRAETADRS